MNALSKTPRRSRADSGFSLLESLIALALLAVAMAMVMIFLDRSHKTLETESSDLETRHAARVAMAEMTYHIQQAGFGIERFDPYNAGEWQGSVVYAGSHMIAFNADIDPDRGPIDSTTTIALPTGGTYRGEGPGGATDGAETYIYTLDANDDGVITATDLDPNGGYHPALETENPLDYGLFRRVYGWDGSDYGGELQPVTGYLFTNATPADVFPDATSPQPLFTYWLTEDISGDGDLNAHECVVAPCPPTGTRSPQIYLWGDSDSDGRLSEAEKTALRGFPVGSNLWAGNPRVTAGVYHFAVLSQVADTTSEIIEVFNASTMGAGDIVRIAGGGMSEMNVISAVDTSTNPDQIILSTTPANPYPSGTRVRVDPRTLQRAIRTVNVTFDAITPRRDFDAATGAAAVGRAGRVGTRGLDYRVWSFSRSLDLANQQARSVATTTSGAPSGGTDSCPNVFAPYIDGKIVASIDMFVPRTDPVPISFIMLDYDGNPMPGYTVWFSNNSSAHGAMAGTSAKTDANGIATLDYVATGVYGIDTVMAMHPCVTTADNLMNGNTQLTLRIHEVNAVLSGPDCLATYETGSTPSTSYYVRVRAPSGAYVPDFPVDLTLGFDPGYLPSPPDFGKVQGRLSAAGAPLGSTNGSDGTLGPEPATTGITAQLTGTISLSQDDDGEGTQLVLEVAVNNPACTACGTTKDLAVGFYKLVIASVTPANCTEISPCTIAPGVAAPTVDATLTINQGPVVNAGVTFVTDDYVRPAPTAASILLPAAPWQTDVMGVAGISVSHNNDPAVNVLTPLKTRIEVTSTGNNGICGNASIAATGLRPEFWFEGPLAP